MNNKQIILAIDFDMTIADTHPFPKIKGFRKGAKKYINKLYDEGYYIIIWTCRTDKDECKDMSDAANFLIDNGVEFHQINENHPALCKAFNNNCRKVCADIYVDDKSIWPIGLPSWPVLYRLIKWQTKFTKPVLSHCKPEHFL